MCVERSAPRRVASPPVLVTPPVLFSAHFRHQATQAWLTEQHTLLLPVPYFLVTFTLPSELRALARQQPEAIYPLLFRTSAAALQQLAQDPRFLGGQSGMLGVLQTSPRDLRYHPHLHYLVPALALAPDAKRWLIGNSDFLLHVKPLGQLFRAKFRSGVGQTPWAGQVDARVWAKSWVVDCRPVGSGASALKYLAPYIFRIALSNNRIEQQAVPPPPRTAAALEPLVSAPEADVRRCPSCGQPMQLVQTLPAKRQQERPGAMVGEPSSRGPPKGLEWAHSVAS
jgi:hypothetical protein